MKGRIPSAKCEPSSGTSTRLYKGRLLLASGCPSQRRLYRLPPHPDQEERRPGGPPHGLGARPQNQPAEAAPPVRAHHDHVCLRSASGLQDSRGCGAVDDRRPHLGNTGSPESRGHGLEIVLGFANHRDLSVDRIGTRKGLRLDRADKNQRRVEVVSDELHRLWQRVLGEKRAVERYQNLVELHCVLLGRILFSWPDPLYRQRWNWTIRKLAGEG